MASARSEIYLQETGFIASFLATLKQSHNSLCRITSMMVTISPLRQTDTEALASSQEASRYIGGNGSAALLASFPFFFTNETPEQWTTYESLLYSCLRTGDDKAAHFFLDKLAGRFGKDDERVIGLRGLYQEAMAEDDGALLQILREYDEILEKNPTNTVTAMVYPSAARDC